MQNVAPTISFIIPVYKTPESFLRKCITSVCEQSYSNIEIILINDGSPDNCPSLCDLLSKTDNRIRVIHQENLGVSTARNMGISKATGEWLCFIDADDWVETTMSEKALSEANKYYSTHKQYPDVIMWNYVKEYGKFSSKNKYFKNRIFGNNTDTSMQELQFLTLDLRSNVGSIWAKLYRRTFIIDNSLLLNNTLTFGEDIEYNVRVFQKVTNAICIKDILYHYRYSNNTASTAFRENYQANAQKFIQALFDDVQHIKNNELFLHKFYERCVHIILAVSVRYTFHKENSGSLAQKKESFIKLCSESITHEAIKNAKYKHFHFPRKIALFCLKNNIFLGTFLIAKIRQIQYSVKK